MRDFEGPARLAKHFSSAKACFLSILARPARPTPQELCEARAEAKLSQQQHRAKGMPDNFARRAPVRIHGPPVALKWL
eukprot:321531-Pyramimonas_sp.AAC.1